MLLCGFSCAYADVPTNNPLDQVLSQFRNSAASWDGALRSASERLFWLLAGISFVAQVIPIAIRGTNIADALEYLVVKTITIGFFYALFVNSATWAEAIVDSLRELGNTATQAGAGVAAFSPSDIFDAGVELASRVVEEMSFWSPGDSLALFIASLLIIVVFALVAAEMFVLIVKMFVIVNAGVIIAAFGGAHWTQMFAVNFLRTALSVGLQLFFLQLVVGMGANIILDWAQNMQQQNVQILTMVGVVIVFYEVAQRVPRIASDFVSGGGFGGGQRLGGSVPGSAMAGVALAGGGVALGSAALGKGREGGMTSYRSAREEGASTLGGAAKGLGSFGRSVGSSLGKAALAEFVTGTSRQRRGNSLERMAAQVRYGYTPASVRASKARAQQESNVSNEIRKRSSASTAPGTTESYTEPKKRTANG